MRVDLGLRAAMTPGVPLSDQEMDDLIHYIEMKRPGLGTLAERALRAGEALQEVLWRRRTPEEVAAILATVHIDVFVPEPAPRPAKRRRR